MSTQEDNGQAKWEYSFYIPRSCEVPNQINWDGDRLNELGAERWEAVCVVGDGLATVGLLMKRRLQ